MSLACTHLQRLLPATQKPILVMLLRLPDNIKKTSASSCNAANVGQCCFWFASHLYQGCLGHGCLIKATDQMSSCHMQIKASSRVARQSVRQCDPSVGCTWVSRPCMLVAKASLPQIFNAPAFASAGQPQAAQIWQFLSS